MTGTLNILYCIPGGASKAYGGGKVYADLAEQMPAKGWRCEVAGNAEVLKGAGVAQMSHAARCEAYRAYIKKREHEFDVIEYDYQLLPFRRDEFSPKGLMVARSVLFEHHLDHIRIPRRISLLSRMAGLARKALSRRERRSIREAADETLRQADLVQVTCPEDRAVLVASGMSPEKIVTLPYGLEDSDLARLTALPIEGRPPRVVFLGTFDWRKGAADMPRIFGAIANRVPDASFLMLGTKGLFADEAAVLRHFPFELHARIQVIPRYDRNDLTKWLSECAVGVFPSYLESFGFAVVEMCAAGVPVVAYRSPGPSMLLPDHCLAKPGDHRAVSEKVCEMLHDPVRLKQTAHECRDLAATFRWDRVVAETDRIYRQWLDAHRPAS